MKKAKMMFTSLAVLAVVGGALAFKAKSHYNSFVYEQDPLNNQCTVLVPELRVTDAGTPAAASSQSTTDPCPATFITIDL